LIKFVAVTFAVIVVAGIYFVLHYAWANFLWKNLFGPSSQQLGPLVLDLILFLGLVALAWSFARGPRQTVMMANFIGILGRAVTIIFSFGAMIGAMITMYAAVANRTQEIGTLRALGFRRRSVLAAFTEKLPRKVSRNLSTLPVTALP
jgi:hypothetical protein